MLRIASIKKVLVVELGLLRWQRPLPSPDFWPDGGGGSVTVGFDGKLKTL